MRNGLYILSQLDDADIRWLATAGAVRSLADGESLIVAGTPPGDLFVVTDGALNVVLPGGRAVAERGVGDVLGEMSLLERRPPAANVLARGRARVLAVPLDALRHELEVNLAFAVRFYKAVALFLSDRLRESTAQRDGTGRKPSLELDESLLDNVHVAGDRLLRLIARLEAR